MTDGLPVIEMRAVTKTYRRGPEEVKAVVEASLALVAGEIVSLVGPSGSGKTTLLNLVCGWEEADSGDFVWKNEPRPSLRDLAWDELAIVPQSLGLVEELTVQENIELPGRFGTKPLMGVRVGQLIADLGLAEVADRLPAEISLGEQQRSSLARALVGSPALLLADEPTGHQDSVWARGVMRALRAAAEEGTACLIATHNPEILRYVDRIIGIRDGVVTEIAPAQGSGVSSS